MLSRVQSTTDGSSSNRTYPPWVQWPKTKPLVEQLGSRTLEASDQIYLPLKNSNITSCLGPVESQALNTASDSSNVRPANPLERGPGKNQARADDDPRANSTARLENITSKDPGKPISRPITGIFSNWLSQLGFVQRFSQNSNLWIFRENSKRLDKRMRQRGQSLKKSFAVFKERSGRGLAWAGCFPLAPHARNRPTDSSPNRVRPASMRQISEQESQQQSDEQLSAPQNEELISNQSSNSSGQIDQMQKEALSSNQAESERLPTRLSDAPLSLSASLDLNRSDSSSLAPSDSVNRMTPAEIRLLLEGLQPFHIVPPALIEKFAVWYCLETKTTGGSTAEFSVAQDFYSLCNDPRGVRPPEYRAETRELIRPSTVT